MSGTILIVEDDRTFRTTVIRYLRRLHFTAFETADLEHALKNLEQQSIDLVILDIGLGKRAVFDKTEKTEGQSGGSGYALLDMIRCRPFYIPVIVLTSIEESIYEVACLQRGADDFLPKDIDLEVLAARAQACIRRVNVLRDANQQSHCLPSTRTAHGHGDRIAGSFLQAGDFHIDISQRLVQVSGSDYVRLSEREVSLLRLMAETPGKIFSKHELLKLLWGCGATQGHSSVDALVKAVRRKIEQKAAKPRYLISVRGLGYRLNLRMATHS